MNERPKRQPTGDYPVGYCKPPHGPRSKKPKATQDAHLFVNMKQALMDKIEVQENSRSRKMTKSAMMANRLVDKAMKDPKARLVLAQILKAAVDRAPAVKRDPNVGSSHTMVVYPSREEEEHLIAEYHAIKLRDPSFGVSSAQDAEQDSTTKPEASEPTQGGVLQDPYSKTDDSE